MPGLLDLEVFVRGLHNLDFLAYDENDREALFRAIDGLKNNVITEDIFELYCEGAGPVVAEELKNIIFED